MIISRSFSIWYFIFIYVRKCIVCDVCGLRSPSFESRSVLYITRAYISSMQELIIQALQWRHNGCDSVSNHQPHQGLLNGLFMRRSKKTSKLRVTGLCAGNSPVTGEFPAQFASNAENVSIRWRHHGLQQELQKLYFQITMIFYTVPCFATDYPCGAWCLPMLVQIEIIVGF